MYYSLVFLRVIYFIQVPILPGNINLWNQEIRAPHAIDAMLSR